MAKKKKTLSQWVIRFILLVVLCGIAWVKYNSSSASNPSSSRSSSQSYKQDKAKHSRQSASHHSRSSYKKTPLKSPKKGKSTDRYETFNRCRLIEHRHNDGDSFHVRLPTGEDVEFRLYYVDTPESSARRYRNGDTNYRRIAEQGRAMGGLTQKQTTSIGQDAKHFVHNLLSKQPFRVITKWEPVYNSDRRYAFVLVSWKGRERFLHEILVDKGIARIHTLGRELPDGTSYYRHKDALKKREAVAKKHRVGAWGVK